MKKWNIALSLFLLLAGLAASPQDAAAQSYKLENATDQTVSLALLLPSSKGWYVCQWHVLQPYSRKTLTKSWALPGKFGFYAFSTYEPRIRWEGGSTAYISNGASTHPYNQTPPGKNVRRANFKIKNGNSVTLTINSAPNNNGGSVPPPPGRW